MYSKLRDVKLKTGENMEVGVVLAPDDEYADKVKPFLDHKPGNFKWHIERCFEEQLDELETRYYIGQINNEVICNIMIVEHRHVGILGHVFTSPDQRQKGACTGVINAQMEDFQRRSGEALYLGTGYDGPAYHIYKSVGFESVYPRSGFMKYWANDDFETKYFAKSETHVKEVQWNDWAKMTALTGIIDGDYLRSIAFNIYGPANFEGGFLDFKRELEDGERYRDAKLLASENGAIVAFATIVADSRWPGDVYILDVFAHPNFWDDADKLLNALELPQGKIQCYSDSITSSKAECLKKTGFQQEAVMKKQIRRDEDTLDVLVFAKY
ncbi:TPA: GNAT family N-acetyltransferase [Candidatus Poribacteria bacterium]|nr:GNAT family N-acetyltransferase [Candidatus Poribacteria bacterium]